MEPLGVTANILGVVVPAVQAVRLLIDDIQRISDAPAAITSLRAELVTSHDILDSLRRTEELPWNSLGETIMAQSMSANTSYEESCKRLRAALNRWTRHSDDASGRLTFLDRTNVGFFKQSQLKTMTAAVEKCKTTLTLVVNVGTLYAASHRDVSQPFRRFSIKADQVTFIDIANSNKAASRKRQRLR
jgi:hypothetical protein